MNRSAWWCAIMLGVMFAMGSIVYADETVDINLPTNIYFAVTDVTQATSGGTTTISYSNASLVNDHKLLISLQANSDLFTPSAGTAIPVGKVSWTGGTPGTLTNTQFRQVYLSGANPTTGSVDITWHLDPLNDLTGLRAGTQTLTATWKVESSL
ncbi:MAG: hypothetical protein ACYC0V_17800 [Armatimonadota bacterium]